MVSPWATATRTPPRRISSGARRTLPESDVAAIAGVVSNTAPRAVSDRGTLSVAGGAAVVSGAESRLAFSTEQAAARSRMGKTCLVIEFLHRAPGQNEGQGRED